MENWQKEHISSNIVMLCEYTRLSAYLLNSFVTADILDIEDILFLEEELDPSLRIRKCYEILMEKPIANVYAKLIGVLEASNQTQAASILIANNKTPNGESEEDTKM